MNKPDQWDGITPTPDHMLLGRAICAVARHLNPPMAPPCAECLIEAGVILERKAAVALYGVTPTKKKKAT